MKEYDVTITETLEMTVTVEAESREEARQKVADNWKNGEYILDAESFKDVEFIPGAEAATGMDDELFFRTSAIPRRGMECSCTSYHEFIVITK